MRIMSGVGTIGKVSGMVDEVDLCYDMEYKDAFQDFIDQAGMKLCSAGPRNL